MTASNLLRYVVVAGLFGTGCEVLAGSPADTNATIEVRELYDFLSGVYTNDTFIFGHQHDTHSGITWEDVPDDSDTLRLTGDYPGLIGWNLDKMSRQRAASTTLYQGMIAQMRRDHRRGSIATIDWHMDAYDGVFTIAEVLPGGTNHTAYMELLADIADIIQDMVDDAGFPIPMIFRPYHEMNGDWYWYGIQNTDEDFRALWVMTVDYLRETRGFHHLLYAYSPTGRAFDTFGSDFFDRWPGDNYVDICGVDYYVQDLHDPSVLADMINLAADAADARGKIAAVAETGFRSGNDFNLAYTATPDFWQTRVLDVISAGNLFSRMAYFHAWRNAITPWNEIPYVYQVPAVDDSQAAAFLTFYNESRTLFRSDISGVLARPLQSGIIEFTEVEEGYASGNLGKNADWGGSHYPYWQVDPSGSGTVAVDYDATHANQFRRAFHNTDMSSSETTYTYSAVFSFERTAGSIAATTGILGLEFNKASATWAFDGLRLGLTRFSSGAGWRLDFASTVAGQFEAGTFISETAMGFGTSDSTSDELMLTFQITRGADATDWSYTGTLSNLTASVEIGSLSGSNRVASAAFFTEDLDIGLNNLVGDQASISNMVIDRVMFNSTSGSSGPVLTGYEAWASDYNLTGGDTDDDDGDGLLNVHEYGLGGNPTNALDTGTAPSFSVSSNAVYTHVMLTDPDADITYLVEHTIDLVNGTWTNSGWTLSTNVTGGLFDEVRHTMPADDQQFFIRFRIRRP